MPVPAQSSFCSQGTGAATPDEDFSAHLLQRAMFVSLSKKGDKQVVKIRY